MKIPKARGKKIGIILPEPHIATGGNQTLVDFAAAAAESHRVRFFFLRRPGDRTQERYFRKALKARISGSVSVCAVSRLLDSHLAPEIQLREILQGKRRWTTARFLLTPSRMRARFYLSKAEILLFSQYISTAGIAKLRVISGASLVLNMAGTPANLEEAFAARHLSEDGRASSAYSDYLRSIDWFLFQTDDHRSLFLERQRWARNRVHVLKPSVNVAEFAGLAKHETEKCSLYPKGRTVILCVGKVGLKGQDLALRAFAEVSGSYTNWDLHFVGSLNWSEAYVTRLKREIADLGLQNRVFFRGHRSDLPHFLACATLLLLSSDAEGAPRVVREAMFVGLPIVAVPISGVRELLSSGRGFLAQARGVDEIAGALTAAFDLPARQMAAEKAKRHFFSVMSPEIYHGGVLALVPQLSRQVPQVNANRKPRRKSSKLRPR